MNGSPSSIISLGLGSWASVGLLITLGYGTTEPQTGFGRVEFTVPFSQPEFTVPKTTQFTIQNERLEFTATEG